MKKTNSAGGIVLNTKKQVLLVSQVTSWSFPKGHVEKGESILDAAKREIYEESGIQDLKLIKAFDSYQRYAVNSMLVKAKPTITRGITLLTLLLSLNSIT